MTIRPFVKLRRREEGQMLKNRVITFIISSMRGRCLVLLTGAVMAVAATSCTPDQPVQPATPTLISVEGHGTYSPGHFRFKAAEFNEASKTVTHYAGSTVKFTVPYPTSIELAIDGKPLTKVDPPPSSNYEYAGTIENPGGNPATWSVGIRTPFDAPYCSTPNQPTSYVLTIVNVSGSTRSQPLTIRYDQPACFDPSTAVWRGTTGKSDTPSSSGGRPGPCAGGAAEQLFRICFKKQPHLPNDVSVYACSYGAAVKLYSNVFAGWSNSPGPCGP